MTVERDWPFGVILLGCLVLAFVVQNNLFIHADVSYLMHVSQMLLAGGRYGFEFFETNPPMILYLSMPPLWLADISGMPLDTCFRLYVLTLAALSLSTSFYLIGKIITNRFIHYFITCIVMFVILFLPSNQFGQREHIYLILITPYVFASACALTKIKIDLRLSLLVGVAAGLGFCMKPYFLLPLILIESYFFYYYRRLFGWV